MKRFLPVVLVAISLGFAQTNSGRLPVEEETALQRITADNLHADLVYLASDELAGRNTPSPGLELAADYIAAHFRKSGLEPAGPNGSYFQVAKFEQLTRNQGVPLVLTSGEKEFRIAADRVRVRAGVAVDYENEPVLKLPAKGETPPVAGRVVAGDAQRYGTEAMLDELQSRKPAMIVLMSRSRNLQAAPPYIEEAGSGRAPIVQVFDSDAGSLLRDDRQLLLSVHAGAPSREEFPLRNVVGILRGSDPALRDQYVVLSAHYDHIGQNAQGIFHGADDNASGTASVIEIADALAALNPHPKRSILFLAVFGEEKGLLGSYYYAHHPLIPLKDTVANVNLEQMGRIDDVSGTEVGTFAFTGPSFSNLPAIVGTAAKRAGVNAYKRLDADDFFERSDNFAFAKEGVVAHTIAVAFEFPGYHGLGDTLDKIDYANMAKVDRGVAAGIVELADEPGVPKWSDSKAAAPYRDAAAK